MMKKLCLLACVLAALGLPQAAAANPIVTIDGPDTLIYQIGPQYLAQSWTSTTDYANVDIAAALITFGGAGRTAEAFLTTQIGPGTTTADEIASATIALPTSGDALIPIFSGLDLPAGTYYLLFAGQNDGNDGWFFTGNGNISTAPGTVYDGGHFVPDVAAQNAYAPASTFFPYSDHLNSGRMVVTGDAVPEPASLVLLGTGLVGVVSRYRRRKNDRDSM